MYTLFIKKTKTKLLFRTKISVDAEKLNASALFQEASRTLPCEVVGLYENVPIVQTLPKTLEMWQKSCPQDEECSFNYGISWGSSKDDMFVARNRFVSF